MSNQDELKGIARREFLQSMLAVIAAPPIKITDVFSIVGNVDAITPFSPAARSLISRNVIQLFSVVPEYRVLLRGYRDLVREASYLAILCDRDPHKAVLRVFQDHCQNLEKIQTECRDLYHSLAENQEFNSIRSMFDKLYWGEREDKGQERKQVLNSYAIWRKKNGENLNESEQFFLDFNENIKPLRGRALQSELDFLLCFSDVEISPLSSKDPVVFGSDLLFDVFKEREQQVSELYHERRESYFRSLGFQDSETESLLEALKFFQNIAWKPLNPFLKQYQRYYLKDSIEGESKRWTDKIIKECLSSDHAQRGLEKVQREIEFRESRESYKPWPFEIQWDAYTL